MGFLRETGDVPGIVRLLPCLFQAPWEECCEFDAWTLPYMLEIPLRPNLAVHPFWYPSVPPGAYDAPCHYITGACEAPRLSIKLSSVDSFSSHTGTHHPRCFPSVVRAAVEGPGRTIGCTYSEEA